MGWASGSIVCIDIWNEVREYVPEKDRAKVLAKVIDVLRDRDWDTENEIAKEWPEADEALGIAVPWWNGWKEDRG